MRANPVAMSSGEAPLLTACWSGDGQRLFFGGCDGKARMWPVLSGAAATQVGAHQAPIRSVHWIEELQVLATAGWDKQLRYWDGRQQQPTGSVALAERLYAMDVSFPLAVLATADKNVSVFDLRKPTVEYKVRLFCSGF
jgi:mRNA export factor